MSTVNFLLLQKPNNIRPSTYRSHLSDRLSGRVYESSRGAACSNITGC
jgi:hypothetical protein